MKKGKLTVLLLLASLTLVACTQRTESQTAADANDIVATESEESFSDEVSSEETSLDEIASVESTETETGNNILIAYFSRLDNTDADLDTLIQGGGPYGEIGSSSADAEMDALSTASIVLREDDIKGNTQVVAEMIQQFTEGDIFSIRTVEPYPVNYDELIDLGGEEKNNAARPELVGQVENMENYDVVFIGFPNWWFDMPMPVYSFLEAYDFSGKRIIPFATSASSGLSDAVSSIQEIQPEADVESNGLHIPMYEVSGSETRIEEWIEELEIVNAEANE